MVKRHARQVFAKNLKRLRLQRGLTQQGLATATGLTPMYISNIERCINNISLDNMERIAQALSADLFTMLIEVPKDATPPEDGKSRKRAPRQAIGKCPPED